MISLPPLHPFDSKSSVTFALCKVGLIETMRAWDLFFFFYKCHLVVDVDVCAKKSSAVYFLTLLSEEATTNHKNRISVE